MKLILKRAAYLIILVTLFIVMRLENFNHSLKINPRVLSSPSKGCSKQCIADTAIKK